MNISIQSIKYHMLNKQAILVVACLVYFMPIQSFSKTISGYIIDKNSNQAVQFATISIVDENVSTTSNRQGFFTLETEAKKVKLLIKHISFYQKIIDLDTLAKEDIQIYLIPKSIQQDEVIVSASFYEQTAESITQPVSVISYSDIQNNMNSNLIDMVASQPGFSQVWEYHSPVILRGLNSERLLIMKDGNRRIGTFPGGYFGQDMNIYDVKKVEIMKGPASVIYGNGAISGIINVISNEPLGNKGFEGDIYSGYGSNNNEFVEVAKLTYRAPNFGISINGKFRHTEDMIYGNGEIAKNSNVEDKDFALNSCYKFSDKHKINLNATYHYGDWGKPRGFNGATKYFTKIRNKEENIHTNFAYSYTPYTFIEKIGLNLYFDHGKRDYYNYKNTIYDELNNLDLVHYKNTYGGGRAYIVMKLDSNNRMTLGSDAYIFSLDNPVEYFDFLNNSYGQAPGYKGAGQRNIGAFVHEEWKYSQKFKTVAGIRYDYTEVTEGEHAGSSSMQTAKRNALSGNIGFVYSPLQNMHLTTNIGRAFRMPTTEELFTTTISCKGIKQGNPNLKPEYSWNFDVGFHGSSFQEKFKYDLALFYNKLDNFIVEYAPDRAPDIDFTFSNTQAWLAGGELSTSYRFDNILKPSNNLILSLGLSYVYGVDLSQDYDNAPLFGMPPLKTNFDIIYHSFLNNNFLTSYNIKLGTELASSQNRVAKIPENTDGGPWGYQPSEAYCIFNFSFGTNFDRIVCKPKLRFIVQNILDNDYKPFGSYIPAMGRNFKIVLIVKI